MISRRPFRAGVGFLNACLVGRWAGAGLVPAFLAMFVGLIASAAPTQAATGVTVAIIVGGNEKTTIEVYGTASDDTIEVVIDVMPTGGIGTDAEDNPIPDEDTRFIEVLDEGTPLIGPTLTSQALLDLVKTDTVEVVRIFAGEGNDIVDCSLITGSDGEGSGADNALTPMDIFGEDGDDQIRCGDGNDAADGGAGSDIIYGHLGNDTLKGGEDADLIFGDLGRDPPKDKKDGNDDIDGGPGDDIVNGDGGDDTVSGGPDNDMVRGDAGNDKLGGGGGFDVLDYATDRGGSGVRVNLTCATDTSAGTATDGYGNTDTIGGGGYSSFQAIRGKATDDNLVGNATPYLDGDPATLILGGGGDDYIQGNRGDDILFGEGGADTIYGGDGDDYIFGGNGSDGGNGKRLVGGPGSDVICGDGTSTLVGIHPDDDDGPPIWPTVVDTLPAEGDPILPVQPGVPAGPTNPWGPLVPPDSASLNIGSDEIYGDTDVAGDGSGDPDIIYGGGGGDTINGNGGDDEIYGDFEPLDPDPPTANFPFGASGADTIRGGPGDDIIFGCAGNDTLIGDDDATKEYDFCTDFLVGGPGVDDIYGGGSASKEMDFSPADIVSYELAAAGCIVDLGPDGSFGFALDDGDGRFDYISGVENVIGTIFDDEIRGTDRADLVARTLGGFFGNDALFYRYASGNVQGFDNILVGLDGNDTLIGGGGNDALIGDGVSSLNLLSPGPGNDILWGDGAGNFVPGGNDWLLGQEGDDELHGEAGNDVLVGGPNADSIRGGAGEDTLDYSFEEGSVVVNLSDAAITVTLPDTTVVTLDPFTARDAGDFFAGIGPAIDTIVNCDADPLATPPADCSDPRNRFIARVEIVQGSPSDDFIFGYSTLPTKIYGLGGADSLTGGAADDTIDGGIGSDVIEGGLGDDALIGGDGGDVAPSAVGDTVSYENAPAASDGQSGVTVDLANGAPQNTVTAGLDTLLGFENLTGSAFNDQLSGDDRVNTLRGLAGDDLLNGRGDADVFQNNVWIVTRDTLDGGAGSNTADYRLGNPFLVDVTGFVPPDGTILNDGEGGTDELTNIQSFLLPNSGLIVTAGPDQVITPGSSVVLAGVASGGVLPYTYVWGTEPATYIWPTDPADAAPHLIPPPGKNWWDPSVKIPGLNDRSLAQPTATPKSTATYRLTVSDAAGHVGSAFVKVTVVTPLVVDAGPDRTIAAGGSTELSGKVSGGVLPYTILWSPAAGLSKTNVLKPTASPTATTTYTLTVTDYLGQVVSDTAVVTVTAGAVSGTTPDTNGGTTGSDTTPPTGDSGAANSDGQDAQQEGAPLPILTPGCGAGAVPALLLCGLVLLAGTGLRRGRNLP